MSADTPANKKFRKELNSGTVALLLLAVIEQADAPLYGYQIAKRIEALDAEVPMMKHGALYPVLRSLEGSTLLASEVQPSVSGPPRRYYQVTDAGRATLGEWRAIWGRTKHLVDTILDGGSDHEDG
jgi:PadR family transcriptional regulator, regulatory protein PadR